MERDITGMRSGKLVALEPTEEKRRGATLWRCRCDCGNELLLEPYRITGGVTKSCGCTRRGRQTKDLTGQRFGRLVARERLEEKSGSCYLWRCTCDCGNEVTVASSRLLGGNVKSCGCARTDALKSRAVDLTGVRFGRLTALRPLEERSAGSVVWECRCDCGNLAKVPSNLLQSGNTTSCGCRRRSNAPPPLHYIDGTCVEALEKRRLRSDNTSGYTGVVHSPRGWVAQIWFKGKRYHLGTYDKVEEAARARQRAEAELHGSFLEWYHAAFPEKAPTRRAAAEESAPLRAAP